MGDMTLLPCCLGECVIVMQRRQRQRQVAHAGTVAAIAFLRRTGQRAVRDVALNATAAGVAHIHRAALEPVHEGVGGGSRVPATAVDKRLPQRQRHLCVVGDLAGLEFEPAAPDHVAVHAVAVLDFGGRHECHRCAQGIADGETEISTQSTFVYFIVSHVSRIMSNRP